jgi:GNAT superfamily N-acetyltransferase
MVTIRKATPADLPRIVEMVGHFITQTSYRVLFKFKPDAIAELAAKVLQIGIVLVADVDGVVVGMIAAFPIEEPIGRQRLVDELAWWVEPDYRRGSIGPRLLGALEKWARQKGLTLCKMIAPVESDVGRFYARLGYRPVETAYVKRL